MTRRRGKLVTKLNKELAAGRFERHTGGSDLIDTLRAEAVVSFVLC